MKLSFKIAILLLQGGLIFSRQLYETFPVEGGDYVVSTINGNISNPSGVEMGNYKGVYGCFVSSSKLQAIYFIDATTNSHTLVAGTPYIGGSSDGQLLHSTFNGPTRMAYDSANLRLFVAERRSGQLRMLDFSSDQTKTLLSPEYSVIRFERTVQSSSIFPGLDVQISGHVLFVVDTLKLYSVSSASGDLKDITSGAVVSEYTSLTDYFNINGYPISATLRSCIYSVAPDEKRRVLYVAVSYAKNVILRVPMNIAELYTAISVLAGDESVTYNGNTGGYTPPASINGNILDSPSTVRLAFPVHLRLVGDSSTLLFSEAYPTTVYGDFLFGSLTVRRISIDSGDVDTYCGVDFSVGNNSIYDSIGSPGGSSDGPTWSAEFAYPMSIAAKASTTDNKAKNEAVRFHSLIIADFSNNAVRYAAAHMNTPAPTPPPTYFQVTQAPSSSSSDGSGVLNSNKMADAMNAVVISIVSVCSCLCLILWIYLMRTRRKEKTGESAQQLPESNEGGGVDNSSGSGDDDLSWAAISLAAGGERTKGVTRSGVGGNMQGIALSVKKGVRRLLTDDSKGFRRWNIDSDDENWGDGELLDVSMSSQSNHSAESQSDRNAGNSKMDCAGKIVCHSYFMLLMYVRRIRRYVARSKFLDNRECGDRSNQCCQKSIF
jgi:hypothetical protein